MFRLFHASVASGEVRLPTKHPQLPRNHHQRADTLASRALRQPEAAPPTAAASSEDTFFVQPPVTEVLLPASHPSLSFDDCMRQWDAAAAAAEAEVAAASGFGRVAAPSATVKGGAQRPLRVDEGDSAESVGERAARTVRTSDECLQRRRVATARPAAVASTAAVAPSPTAVLTPRGHGRGQARPRSAHGADAGGEGKPVGEGRCGGATMPPIVAAAVAASARHREAAEAFALQTTSGGHASTEVVAPHDNRKAASGTATSERGNGFAATGGSLFRLPTNCRLVALLAASVRGMRQRARFRAPFSVSLRSQIREADRLIAESKASNEEDTQVVSHAALVNQRALWRQTLQNFYAVGFVPIRFQRNATQSATAAGSSGGTGEGNAAVRRPAPTVRRLVRGARWPHVSAPATPASSVPVVASASGGADPPPKPASTVPAAKRMGREEMPTGAVTGKVVAAAVGDPPQRQPASEQLAGAESRQRRKPVQPSSAGTPAVESRKGSHVATTVAKGAATKATTSAALVHSANSADVSGDNGVGDDDAPSERADEDWADALFTSQAARENEAAVRSLVEDHRRASSSSAVVKRPVVQFLQELFPAKGCHPDETNDGPPTLVPRVTTSGPFFSAAPLRVGDPASVAVEEAEESTAAFVLRYEPSRYHLLLSVIGQRMVTTS